MRNIFYVGDNSDSQTEENQNENEKFLLQKR